MEKDWDNENLPPPFRSVPGIANFRDIGGLPVSSSSSGFSSSSSKAPNSDDPQTTTTTTPRNRIIKHGVLFRSAEPSRITPAGHAALTALNITHIYDLRSSVETRRAPFPSLLSSSSSSSSSSPSTSPSRPPELVPAPVFHDQDYSPAAIALRFQQYAHGGVEGFVDAYRAILRSGAAGPFAAILRRLSSRPGPEVESGPTPILVHCTAGKDRTGVICALVESLCGVSDEDVAREYALTEVGLGEKLQELRRTLSESPALGGDSDGALRMLSARPESMLATLQMIRDEYGSVEEYVLKQCGLTAEDVAQIRHNLIVDAPTSPPPRPSV